MMTEVQKHQQLCCQFAALLCYPTEGVKGIATESASRLEEVRPQAVAPLQSFIRFLDENDPVRVEEVYTATFDLQAHCHPYVGYQLCGESQQRTMFLMKLQELYRQHDFAQSGELPDHLSEVLRFIGTTTDQGCRWEIIQDGLLPALAKILNGMENENQPYGELMKALQLFLADDTESGAEPLTADR